MSDTPAVPSGQEPVTQPVGQEPAVTPTSEIPVAVPATSWFDALPAEAQAEIKKLRSESAAHRKAAKDTERAAEERRQAELSDLERTREEAQKITQERDALINDLRREMILNSARSRGAVDPDAVYALLDKDSLQWEGRQSVNLDEQINALLTAKSYLRAPAAPVVPLITPPAPGRQQSQQSASRPGGYRL